MPHLFSDGKTPEEAGRDDARAAMVEPRRMLRAAAKICGHDPVLDGPSGIHVCSKCRRGVNAVSARVAGQSKLLNTRIHPFPK